MTSPSDPTTLWILPRNSSIVLVVRQGEFNLARRGCLSSALGPWISATLSSWQFTTVGEKVSDRKRLYLYTMTNPSPLPPVPRRCPAQRSPASQCFFGLVRAQLEPLLLNSLSFI